MIQKQFLSAMRPPRNCKNKKVQTVNWEGRGEGAVDETGVKSSLKKVHKNRGNQRQKRRAQTVN